MAVLQNVSEVTTIPEALVNTLLGMGTVFLVLILISFIIYLFKFIPKLLGAGKKQEPGNAAVPRGRETPAPKPEVVRETEDEQLAAVIMAAVAAHISEETGEPAAPGSLVIRSIKKRTTFSI